MKLKILSAAFLVGVSGTSLLAQPTPTTCTNTSDTICVGLATVYNSIIATTPPVPATTSLQNDLIAALNIGNFLTNKSNLTNNPLYQCIEIINNCKSKSPAPACSTSAYTTLNTACYTFQGSWMGPQNILAEMAAAIPRLIQNQGNMSSFNVNNGNVISQVLSAVNALNTIDSALSTYSTSTAGASSSHKSSPAPTVPAAPAKVAPPVKK